MRKALIVIMSVLILYTTNFVAYDKARAESIAVAEQLKVAFGAIMGGVAAVAASAAHTTEWLQENIDDVMSHANTYWDNLSTAAKDNFVASLTAAEGRLTIAKDFVKSFYQSYADAKYLGLASYTVSNGTFTLNTVKVKFYSNTINQYVTADTKLLLNMTYSTSAPTFKVLARANSVNTDHLLVNYTADSFEQRNQYMNSISFPQNTSLIAAVAFANAFGADLSIYNKSSDELLYGNGVNLELDNVMNDYLANVDNSVVLDGNLYDWAVPTTPDGKVLTQSDLGVTYPDGTSYSGDIVYKPSIPSIKDIEGVPTAVITKPDGTTINLETGEIINSVDPVPPITDTDGFFATLFDWLKKILNAILGIPAAILSALGALLTSLFVPDTTYWQNNFNNLNGELKRVLDPTAYTSILESFQNLSSPKFNDITVPSIMGSPTVVIVESDYINGSLSTIHNWIRGFFFVLLLLYNINMIYKLVRGGDVMSAAARREARSGND